jgi:hypothetical protein
MKTRAYGAYPPLLGLLFSGTGGDDPFFPSIKPRNHLSCRQGSCNEISGSAVRRCSLRARYLDKFGHAYELVVFDSSLGIRVGGIDRIGASMDTDGLWGNV